MLPVDNNALVMRAIIAALARALLAMHIIQPRNALGYCPPPANRSIIDTPPIATGYWHGPPDT